mmetsp:Transcript_50878/g.146853  ORF Transcript_50878/g.146853 Transcript_50878/m.146853 type:complete len:207 (+) Transcript_50878:331-951(+)
MASGVALKEGPAQQGPQADDARMELHERRQVRIPIEAAKQVAPHGHLIDRVPKRPRHRQQPFRHDQEAEVPGIEQICDNSRQALPPHVCGVLEGYELYSHLRSRDGTENCRFHAFDVELQEKDAEPRPVQRRQSARGLPHDVIDRYHCDALPRPRVARLEDQGRQLIDGEVPVEGEHRLLGLVPKRRVHSEEALDVPTALDGVLLE